MIYHYSPKIIGNEFKYVKKSIKEGWISLGSNIEKFENKIKKYLNIKYSVAVNSVPCITPLINFIKRQI